MIEDILIKIEPPQDDEVVVIAIRRNGIGYGIKKTKLPAYLFDGHSGAEAFVLDELKR